MTKPKDKPDFTIDDHLMMAVSSTAHAHAYWKQSKFAVTIVAVESALANLNAAYVQLRQYERERP